MPRAFRSMILAAMVAMLSAVGPAAWALEIGPGFDFLRTPPGTAFLPDPDGDGPVPAIPLMGVPFSPGLLGNTDIVVERKSSLPAGGTGRIEAEIVALNLKSVQPVVIQDSFFDVFVTLDNRPAQPPIGGVQILANGAKLNPSTGVIDILTHDDVNGGGTFDSTFTVFTKAIFRQVRGDVVLGPFFRSDVLSSTGTPWSHTCAPGLLCLAEGTAFDLPSGDPPFTSGNFFITPGGILQNPPHSRTDPARSIPAPPALLVFGLGLALLAKTARRRRT